MILKCIAGFIIRLPNQNIKFFSVTMVNQRVHFIVSYALLSVAASTYYLLPEDI